MEDLRLHLEPADQTGLPRHRHAPATDFGHFTDFQADAAAGTLPGYAFVEPSWSSTGNSQHPNYNVALGEQLLLDTYRALRDGPDVGVHPADHHLRRARWLLRPRRPTVGATPPDDSFGEFGFDFTRFGVRVPTVLVSPLIPAGTVYRVPDGATPFDHTSILATVEHRWGLTPLTHRDAAAPDVAAALTLTTPRTDDPLAGITAPTPPTNPTGLAVQASHLQEVQAELLAAQDGGLGTVPTDLRTNDDYSAYIRENS